MRFADECNSKGMDFYLKTGYSENGRIVEEFTKLRDDTIIIYCDKNNLSNYVNIVDDIVHKNGIPLEEPPLLSGKVNGTNIGIGAEPTVFGGRESFNGLREKIISNARKIVEQNYRKLGIVKNSDAYYEYFRKTIIDEGNRYNVNPNNFCLEN